MHLSLFHELLGTFADPTLNGRHFYTIRNNDNIGGSTSCQEHLSRTFADGDDLCPAIDRNSRSLSREATKQRASRIRTPDEPGGYN